MSPPPSGRVYRKTAVSDELTTWSLSDALSGKERVFVMVSPTTTTRDMDLEALFQPRSLGNLDLIPEPYRQFWAFEQRCTEIEQQGSDPCDASTLCREIDAWLSRGLSQDTLVALCQVRLTSALMARDLETISHAIQGYGSALLKQNAGPMEEAFCRLQNINAELAERYSEDDRRRLIDPSVTCFSGFAAFQNPFFVQDILNLVIRQGDYFYAQLWIDALRRQRCIDGKILDRLDRYLEIRGWRPSCVRMSHVLR